jgi:phosphate transport system substrate-binding protein
MRMRAAIIAIGVAVATALLSIGVSAQEIRLIGSGASFPFPIYYSAWFKDFSKQNKGVTVDYQAKGSGAGIQDFTNKTVDFAASDAAMTDDESPRSPMGSYYSR